ncbi:hypothetical protein D9615_005932 [Tricholomella constricta]|uniref:cystathionine gamma-synthase n=1 Tax=Tricholomella constricta TaxID=117010 RepID=A0A8H5H9F2_9AGAR|nr:hypothetical protein D9615_005932 [Tricholomella constricta]
MTTSRRQSQSLSSSWTGDLAPLNLISPPAADSEQWTKDWGAILARDLIDSRIVIVDADTSVEDACDTLLAEDILCLAVKSQSPDATGSPYLGLFDFSDVNAFLTLAATSHTLLPEDLLEKPRSSEIVSAARAGRVEVHLVSNFSEKNPLETLPNDATILSLLELFSRGTHRALVRSASSSDEFVGMVSDRGLLTWFASYATKTPSLQLFLSNSLHSLSLPSLNIYSAVIGTTASSTVLDAMRLMSEEGVSSVAVIDDDSGALLSAVSVTDIGKLVVPSQSKQILSTPLHLFISLIKESDGSTDGADKYPVYSVSPSSRLSYTIEKLLATNAHRLFVTTESRPSSPNPLSTGYGGLSGIVSIVDILSLFARLANISDIDPTRMQRHRRASSTSSQSSMSEPIITSNIPLGLSVPPHTPHAISVSLPTWRDNVGYEEGEKRVVDSMVSGYPRFFIHLSIQKLARIFEQKYGLKGERCMVFATQRVAEQCRSFLQTRSVNSRLLSLLICPEDKANGRIIERDSRTPPDSSSAASANVHIVLFGPDSFPVAKEFWQHTGMGISSRLAEHCLSMLPDDLTRAGTSSSPPITPRFPAKAFNKHYSVKGQAKSTSPPTSPFVGSPTKEASVEETLDPDHSVYLEERYGRNLPLAYAASAKRALRRRVAGVLIRDNNFDCQGEPSAGDKNLVVGPSSRGVADVSENDVFLYPTGMAAIWNAHHIALAVRPAAKSVCFGFPYTDTLKILQKWGPGCYFFGEGIDSEIDDLEAVLEQEAARNPGTPPILALFTEFPSNPLLRSANLPRLRALADKYDFLIIIDETIGNFVNVEVLPYADIVVSSLSKVFSGVANVMGGSLVLNPGRRHYAALKAYLDSTFEDLYYDEDSLYMERNSRDFQRRIRIIDINTETVCDFLRAHSVAGGAASGVIKEVFYPKYITRENYEHCRIVSPGTEGGFGGLFSLTFTSATASQAFFDALPCYKGPSLGTNFTLACPFTILAHYTELDWAAQYGVEEGLVRISVGMEEAQALLRSFEVALKAAEAAVRT